MRYVVIALLGLAGCTCERLSPGGATKAPASSATTNGNLGGGYQGAKWGMSKAQVKQISIGRLTGETATSLVMTLGRAQLTFDFAPGDKLAAVVYAPNFADDARERGTLLPALEAKYGPARALATVDGGVVSRWTWSDGETRIELREPAIDARSDKPSEQPGDEHGSSGNGTSIVYQDISAARLH